ncbi:MAG TPA: DUF3857 domain-containing protein [Clostridia bacterium]|nr:DUF3857 domain-containing protein [Clostridia bacterium]
MTSEPLAPGAPAIVLFRQVDRDDTGVTAHEDNYFRIKILTEEGRKYGDIEIPFAKLGGGDVVALKARTIRPDGTIVDFQGKVYEKAITKAKGLKYFAKTFTLPDVQGGSIIEYSYTIVLEEHYVFNSHWILSNELFTKLARFSLKPYTNPSDNFHLRWTWQLLPPGTEAPKQGIDNFVRLQVNNIPGFRTEDFMPPETELKARVDFTYTQDHLEMDPVRFWKKRGKKLNDKMESFVDSRKAMEQAVTQIVSATDSPELKLQKIYARVQQLRNTSFEVRKTEQEQKRSKEKNASNVEEVWKRGYGNGVEITWVFLGLVRAAGIEAYGVMVSDRSNYFFDPRAMDANKLNSNVVLVKVNGKDVYCDPGAAFTPLGLLPWQETGVGGLRLDKEGGTWIETSVPTSAESRIERKADLKLTDTGDLEGKLTITFVGLEALQRRIEQRHSDEADRKKFLEDQVKEYIPAASEVDLSNKPEWNSSSNLLVAEFAVRIPGWASSAGRRVLLPVGIFSASEKRVFDHAERIHPIYFAFPFQKIDDVTIAVPGNWQTDSVPPAQVQDAKAVVYTLSVDKGNGTLHLTRKLKVDVMLLESKHYPTLRAFFQAVRTGDEEQIILRATGAKGSE